MTPSDRRAVALTGLGLIGTGAELGLAPTVAAASQRAGSIPLAGAIPRTGSAPLAGATPVAEKRPPGR